jgi:protease IV
MGNFFKLFLASFLALIVFFVGGFILMLIVGAISAASGSKTSIGKNSIITINASDAITEQTKEDNFSLMGGAIGGTSGLTDLKNAIQYAKNDDKVKGIYLKLGMSVNSWATLQDLKASLEDFKTSKKFIYAYGELMDQKSFYLASAADSVFVNPVGAMELKGLSITGTFYKKALDKLEVQPEVFYCGKFKGASEPYRLEKFSDPNKQQLGDLLNDFSAEFLSAIAKKTGKTPVELQQIAENLSATQPKEAASMNLIDGVKYESDMITLFKNKLGFKAKEKLRFVDANTYITSTSLTKDGNDKIAVLFAEGTIVDGEGEQGQIASKPMMRTIRKIAEDDDIKSVVLRVNSPGGSALASENIWNELQILHQKKPIVVSMGDVAASGGYYISCAADSIFAMPNTITGSIGVVGMMLNFENFMKNKIGVTTDVVKTAAHADMPSVTRALTADEKALIQKGVDSIYATFKNRVMAARKISQSFADSIAQGHVYSGTKAKSIQLVDQLGNLDRALASAASLAKLKEYGVDYYPVVKDPVTKFIEDLKGKKDNEAILKAALGEDYKVYQTLKSLRSNMDQIQMRLPFELEIK